MHNLSDPLCFISRVNMEQGMIHSLLGTRVLEAQTMHRDYRRCQRHPHARGFVLTQHCSFSSQNITSKYERRWEMPVKQNNFSGQEGSASYHDSDNSVKVTKQNKKPTKNTHHTATPTSKKTKQNSPNNAQTHSRTQQYE